MSGSRLATAGLRRDAPRAIGRALEYLERTVDAGGAWPSRVYANPDCTGPAGDEQVPFVAALGALSLRRCSDPRAERLRVRTRGFLLKRMEPPGVWRYWPALPPDLDDTAVCSLAVGPHVYTALGRTLPAVLRQREAEGRFRTWMRGDPDAGTPWDDVDSVVNANVVAWLGDCPETRPAQRWLETVVREGREKGSSWYYPDRMDLYAAMARAAAVAEPVFGALRPLLAARILERRQTDGSFGAPHRTAQGVSGLDRLRAALGSTLDLASSVARLVETQNPDGSWPSDVVWQGPPPPAPPSAWFVSEALATACGVEALARAPGSSGA